MRLVGVKRLGKVTWTIYSEKISEKEKLWGSARLSHEELVQKSGITDIRELAFFRKDVEELAKSVRSIYLRQIDKGHIYRGFGKYSDIFTTLEPLMRDIRIIKLPEEIEKIRKAISITHEAYRVISDVIRPGIYEYEIEAEIARVFRSHHAIEAYPTIVASGPSACTLHYTRHDRKIEAGELVLVDFGAEFE
jgi:Xaa-Pro aminopeptidase